MAEGTRTASQRLAALIGNLDVAQLSQETVAAAAAHLLDGIGITVAGARTPLAGVVRRYLSLGDAQREVGCSSREQRPIPPPPRDLEDCGFLLGCHAFSLNYGDTSLRSVAHPNTVVVPTILAASQQAEVSGDDAVGALVAGYQALEFAAQTLNNGNPRLGHQLRGFRPTASCGAIGAAATLASLWNLDEDTLAVALELACNAGSGLRRASGRGWLSANNIHSGEAVRAGVQSVLLATCGLLGDDLMFEGPGGFFSAHSGGELDASAKRYLSSGVWAVNDVAFKFHATAHTLHTALDCLLAIQRKHRFAVEEIEHIDVYVPAPHAEISGGPPRPPRDPREAGSSFSYAAAVVARSIDYAWPSALEAGLRDPAILKLQQRVRLHADETMTRRFEHDAPGSWPAGVEVESRGLSAVHWLDEPIGLPMDDDARQLVDRKFRYLVGHIMPFDVVDAAITLGHELAACSDFTDAIKSMWRWIRG